VPSTKGKVFVHFPDRHFYSLPMMLCDNGYETIFFQANGDIHFDNTKNFLLVNGFLKVETVADHMKDGDKKSYWGWGLEDDVFFRRFFEYLDGLRAGGEIRNKPLFVTLATVMNHPRFDLVPKPKRHLYPHALVPEQHYANSVHLMDEYLKVFFDELGRREYLKGSIVIITGDHSYPVGEHGYYGSEESFYEEFFRTPFLLLWKDRLLPERITGTAYSQMDIAPTLLDMLDLPVRRYHFEGVSIFDKKEALHPIYLVQPYSGKYLSVVYYPYKYTLHVSKGCEFLFDLENDPKEKKNLMGLKEYEKVLEDMRAKLGFVFNNQKLIEKDEIWPKAFH
jgi:phosphoglycerol transferase MdoB-like AlkP superfamily enzyme